MKSESETEQEAQQESERPLASIVKKQKKASKRQESVLKKRTRKQSQMMKCDFLDFEAQESDDGRRNSSHRSVKFDEKVAKRGK